MPVSDIRESIQVSVLTDSGQDYMLQRRCKKSPNPNKQLWNNLPPGEIPS